MDKRRKVLTSGAFAGKTITLTSPELVDAFAEIAAHFMSAIFELDPGDYLITDESDVLDFVSIEISDTDDIWRKIEATYGVTLPDVNSGRLAKIFAAIESRRRVQ
jgi:hypothetical protein